MECVLKCVYGGVCGGVCSGVCLCFHKLAVMIAQLEPAADSSILRDYFKVFNRLEFSNIRYSVNSNEYSTYNIGLDVLPDLGRQPTSPKPS